MWQRCCSYCHSVRQLRFGQERTKAALRRLSGAQFLNVIESVFSGMARAILHNSNYQSVFGCKEAIDRYFAERNQAFLEHPRRAGNKIWGKERVEAVFREENNCKDPRWR
jgi:hypothetical protein